MPSSQSGGETRHTKRALNLFLASFVACCSLFILLKSSVRPTYYLSGDALQVRRETVAILPDFEKGQEDKEQVPLKQSSLDDETINITLAPTTRPTEPEIPEEATLNRTIAPTTRPIEREIPVETNVNKTLAPPTEQEIPEEITLNRTLEPTTRPTEREIPQETTLNITLEPTNRQTERETPEETTQVLKEQEASDFNQSSFRRERIYENDDQTQAYTTSNVTLNQVPDNDMRPRNLRLVMYGDSVTRYQYISLVYYLKHNRWINETQPELLFKKIYHQDLNDFLEVTNQALVPQESCDCWKPPGKFYMASYCENRYYRDDELGNYVTFINKYGKRSSHGHWRPDEVYRNNGGMWNSTAGSTSFEWSGNWSKTILNHIGKLEPRPKYMVLNAGLHPNQLHQEEVQESILDATEKVGITPIYKTTTYPKTNTRETRFNRGRHDRLLCGKVFSLCLNLKWTADYVGNDHYFDDNHFKPHLNMRMNHDLLDLLRSISAADFPTDRPFALPKAEYVAHLQGDATLSIEQ